MKIPKKDRITVGYCRISSKKQKDNLKKQVKNIRMYLTTQGKLFKMIEDVGSGMNDNRKGLQNLIKKYLRIK